jgi:hypothetical protein
MPSLPLRCLSMAVVLLAASTSFGQPALFSEPADELTSPDLFEMIRQRSLDWQVVHLPIPEFANEGPLQLPELILTELIFSEAPATTAEPPAAGKTQGEAIKAPQAPGTPLPTYGAAAGMVPGMASADGCGMGGDCCGGDMGGGPCFDAPNWACYPPCYPMCCPKKCGHKCRHKKCCQPCCGGGGYAMPCCGDMGWGGDPSMGWGGGPGWGGGFDGFDGGCCGYPCCPPPCCGHHRCKHKRCCGGGCGGMPYDGCGWGSYYGAFGDDCGCYSGCCGRKRCCKSRCGGCCW